RPDPKRRLPPAPARHVGGAARLGIPARALAGASPRARLADARPAGRERARPRPRAGWWHLGGARRAEPLHLVESVLLARGRPRRAPGCDARRAGTGRALA